MATDHNETKLVSGDITAAYIGNIQAGTIETVTVIQENSPTVSNMDSDTDVVASEVIDPPKVIAAHKKLGKAAQRIAEKKGKQTSYVYVYKSGEFQLIMYRSDVEILYKKLLVFAMDMESFATQVFVPGIWQKEFVALQAALVIDSKENKT